MTLTNLPQLHVLSHFFKKPTLVSGGEGEQIDLFSDFNGLPDENAKTEFYQHDANWTNRMILVVCFKQSVVYSACPGPA